MIEDSVLIPICKGMARRFAKQAMHLGGTREEVVDELVDVGYAIGKEETIVEVVRVKILWAMARYVKVADNGEAIDRSDEVDERGRLRLVDRRCKFKDDGKSELEMIEMEEMVGKIVKALASLSEMEREMVMWYFRDDLTFIQIGERMELNRETVRMRMKEILGRMKEMIGGVGEL